MKINAYRFGSKSYNFIKDSSLTVLKRRRISQVGCFEDYIIAGADKTTLSTDNYKKRFIVEAVNQIKAKSRILVLTKKEKFLIYKCGILNNIHIVALEEIFPFIKGIFYCSNSEKNLLNLQKTIKRCKKLNLDMSFFIDEYNHLQNKLVRKIYKINNLDYNFYHIPVFPYQEVFKFIEENPQKEIIAFDFNSMYSDAMSGFFPDPSELEYHKIMQLYNAGSNLENGVYKVQLSYPDNFINEFHSIKYVNNFDAFPFKICNQDIIETLLTKDEIEYYSKHFKSVYLIESVTSKKSILHPLVRNRDRLFNTRLHYKKQNNEELAKLHKILLTILHSIPNARVSKTKNFISLKSIVNFLDKEFGLNKNENTSDAAFLMKINSSSFYLSTENCRFCLTYPNYKNNIDVYSLYSYVIARARIKMMETLEYMYLFPNVEICYTNVDSIHVSINKKQKEQFLEYLNKVNLIGNNLGQMKIEIIADKGYWISPGRYWLLDDKNKIVQSKNICLMNEFSSDDIDTIRKTVTIKKYGSELIPIEKIFSIFNSHFVRKKLSGDQFERIKISNILDKNYKITEKETIQQIDLLIKSLIFQNKR